LAALAEACQIPPGRPLIRENVFVAAPPGKGAFVLYPVVGAIAALGLAVFNVVTRLVFNVDDLTLTEAHPTPVPLMRPDQPAKDCWQWLTIIPVRITHPSLLKQLPIFFMTTSPFFYLLFFKRSKPQDTVLKNQRSLVNNLWI
jgi:hypothetical protein